MLHYTVIARIIDGLPLAASVDSRQSMTSSSVDLNLNGDNDALLNELKRQAKLLLKRFTPLAERSLPPRGSIEDLVEGKLVFHYVVEKGVCFLTLCEKSYARVLAFAYLMEIQRQFLGTYANEEIQTARRPFPFIRFESEITKLSKRYANPRSLRTQTDLAELAARIQTWPTHRFLEIVPDYKAPAGLSSANLSSLWSSASTKDMSMDDFSLTAQGVPFGSHNAPLAAFKYLFYTSKLEFLILMCWIWLAFRNFTFDLPLGLSWFSVFELEDHILAKTAGDHLVSSKKWDQGGAANSYSDLALHGHVPRELRGVAFVFGLGGVWLVFQIWNTLFRRHTSSSADASFIKQLILPSPPFSNMIAIGVHLFITFGFLIRTLRLESAAHFSYTRLIHYGNAIILPKDTSWWNIFTRWDLLLYWIYLGSGLLLLVNSKVLKRGARSITDRKLN